MNANSHCHVMNKSWATNLFELAAAAGGKLVFGLNINPRNASTGRWDPTQARGLIQFAQANGYSIYGFELGNEQNKAFNAPSEAADFKVLSELVNEMYPESRNLSERLCRELQLARGATACHYAPRVRRS